MRQWECLPFSQALSQDQIHGAFLDLNYKMKKKNIEMNHRRNRNLMSIANLFFLLEKENVDKYEVRYLVPYSSNSNAKLLNMPRNQSAIVPPCEQ